VKINNCQCLNASTVFLRNGSTINLRYDIIMFDNVMNGIVTDTKETDCDDETVNTPIIYFTVN